MTLSPFITIVRRASCRYYGTRWRNNLRCRRGYHVAIENNQDHQGCALGSPYVPSASPSSTPTALPCIPVAPCTFCTWVDIGSPTVSVCTACAIGFYMDSATKQCKACDGSAGQSASQCSKCGVGASHVCRAAVGDCDVAETCDGTSLACPANKLKTCPAQIAALVDLYDSTGGATTWAVSTNWKVGDPCNPSSKDLKWSGVTCTNTAVSYNIQ